MQIAIAEEIIKTGLVNKVFHSCELVRDENGQVIYPAYKIGGELSYAGISDTKGLFAYIRNNGDPVGANFKVDSCGKNYQMTAPLRVVFFSDYEKRDFETLITQLTSFSFLSKVTLVRIINDKFRLIREESPMFQHNFDGKTFYVAFDVTVSFVLLKSNCEFDSCKTYLNPVTSCPAVVQISSESATS